MKATGVVRRIDDLGRIVIPKEIRRTLKIGEGSPLEIFTEKDGEIVLKKYTGTYKDSLEYLISVMVGKTIGQADIRKMIRKM